VLGWSVNDALPQLVHVERRHGLRVRQLQASAIQATSTKYSQFINHRPDFKEKLSFIVPTQTTNKVYNSHTNTANEQVSPET
jgi:hypothetical protein